MRKDVLFNDSLQTQLTNKIVELRSYNSALEKKISDNQSALIAVSTISSNNWGASEATKNAYSRSIKDLEQKINRFEKEIISNNKFIEEIERCQKQPEQYLKEFLLSLKKQIKCSPLNAPNLDKNTRLRIFLIEEIVENVLLKMNDDSDFESIIKEVHQALHPIYMAHNNEKDRKVINLLPPLYILQQDSLSLLVPL